MPKETEYRCSFQYFDKRMEASSPRGIGEFSNGFWLNKDLEYTKGANCVYWIPPCKINCIKIVQGTGYES